MKEVTEGWGSAMWRVETCTHSPTSAYPPLPTDCGIKYFITPTAITQHWVKSSDTRRLHIKHWEQLHFLCLSNSNKLGNTCSIPASPPSTHQLLQSLIQNKLKGTQGTQNHPVISICAQWNNWTEGFVSLNIQKVIDNLPVHTKSSSSREGPDPTPQQSPVLPAVSRHGQAPLPKASFP